MTAQEIIEFVEALPGAEAMTADEAGGAPEVAWGDTFFFIGEDRKLPFATIVTKDYEGFDTSSNLNRPGVFRVNIGVGRAAFPALFGDRTEFRYDALDELLPHPAYATQGWVCVVNPGPATDADVRGLLRDAHARAAARKHRSVRGG